MLTYLAKTIIDFVLKKKKKKNILLKKKKEKKSKLIFYYIHSGAILTYSCTFYLLLKERLNEPNSLMFSQSHEIGSPVAYSPPVQV